MQPLISVIIPVYNAAPYVKRCIESVLHQTFEAIEIIAVNDGSTDESAAVLNELAATDKRLVVIDQSNTGVSASRNKGLANATGSYIAFCDADDWMEPDMLEQLYTAVNKTECDWVFCNAYLEREGQPAKLRLSIQQDHIVKVAANRPDFIHLLMRFRYDYANWNKLFKAEIIKQNNLRFSEDMSVAEDLLFNLHYMRFVNRVAVLAAPLYHYQITANSLYSGQMNDRIPQVNLLYRNYRSTMKAVAGEEEQLAFRQEMARITYNQLLYEMELRIKSSHHSFVKIWSAYKQELYRLDKELFYFQHEKLRGFQGYKKRWLVQGRYGLVSLLITAKPFLKPFFKPLSKIVKKYRWKPLK